MPFRYIVHEKGGGTNHQIDPARLTEFFRTLEHVTGLDRPIAEAMLHGGQKIDHPKYTFHAERINPFEPTRLV